MSFPGPGAARALGSRESRFHISLSQGPQGDVQGGRLQLCLWCGQLVRKEQGLWGSAHPVSGCQSALTALGARGACLVGSG